MPANVYQENNKLAKKPQQPNKVIDDLKASLQQAREEVMEGDKPRYEKMMELSKELEDSFMAGVIFATDILLKTHPKAAMDLIMICTHKNGATLVKTAESFRETHIREAHKEDERKKTT